jgi:hypothetical protein
MADTCDIVVLHGMWVPWDFEAGTIDHDGEDLKLNGLQASTTIGQLKNRIILANTESPYSSLCPKGWWFNEKNHLMYAGRTLDESNRTLQDYGISAGCCVAFAHWYTFNVPLSKYKLALFTKAFERYDTDGSGEIDARELHVLVNELGVSRTLSQCRELIDINDADGSGEIDFTEFCELMVQMMQDDVNDNVLAAMEGLQMQPSDEELRNRDSGCLIMWEAPTSTN